MQSKYTDFIGLYDNVFEDGFCDQVIKEFEYLYNEGVIRNRQDEIGNPKKHQKNDDWFVLNFKQNFTSKFNGEPIFVPLLRGIQECFSDYMDEFDILKDVNISGSILKVQKTPPGGGYHLWHFEQSYDEMSTRCLVYAIYLNTIEEAGETEFLYQKLRIPPKENTAMIWPASFTHTHRGNVVHGDKSKYIITGWFNLE
jgi:hypothetical protein